MLLRAQLLLTVNTLSFHRRFHRLRQASPFKEFAEPVALLVALHVPGADGDQRNTILGALVTCAQTGDADVATTLLLLALWPGLDAAAAGWEGDFRGETDLLVSEISERMAGIGTLDLRRVNGSPRPWSAIPSATSFVPDRRIARREVPGRHG